MCKKLRCNIINNAIGGSTIAVKGIEGGDTAERKSIVTSISSWTENVDCVVVAGGSNDWNYSRSYFGMLDMDSTSPDISTFCGAV